MKKALKQHPDVPELQAQMAEVQRLLKDLREGLAAHPEADKLEGTPGPGHGARVILVGCL